MRTVMTSPNCSWGDIPNIVHFVFGFKEQTEEFLFAYYLAIYSAYKVNDPEKIIFWYHYEPYGKWWEETKLFQSKYSGLEFKKIEIPTHFGKKEITKTAHKADKARMDILYEHGGIYMDIDTISVRPYKNLIFGDRGKTGVVLGKENIKLGICNAVMITKPKSEFFTIWRENYEKFFDPNKWNEASVQLPALIAIRFPQTLSLQRESVFFLPSWNETHKIFEPVPRGDMYSDIPETLVTLHLWESCSMKYLKKIEGFEWADSEEGRDTLYGKMMKKVM